MIHLKSVTMDIRIRFQTLYFNFNFSLFFLLIQIFISTLITKYFFLKTSPDLLLKKRYLRIQYSYKIIRLKYNCF